MLRSVLCAALVALNGLAPQPLTVCAAVSLTDALQEIARAYENAGGGPVRFNLAASNVLARQLVNGAPADLFISADEAQMDLAARAGAIDPSSRVDLVGNRLAILSRSGGPAVQEPRDLATDRIRRIAVGDPSAVPAGVYARRFLETAQLWPSVQHRIVPVGNVRAALTSVLNGSADAAIVYESDTLAAPGAKAVVISGAHAPKIVYPAAIVSRTRDRAGAERFLTFLCGSEAAAIFARFRFAPLARGR